MSESREVSLATPVALRAASWYGLTFDLHAASERMPGGFPLVTGWAYLC
jgi:hypothetical protein